MSGELIIDALRALGHDLRRPLTVIRGASTLLVDDADRLPAESRREMLRLIDRSAAAMDERIEDLLTAVHLELGDVFYEIEVVELRALVDEAMEGTRAAAPERSFDVRGLDGLRVEADRGQAVRALRALLANAVQYSPPGSLIEVEAGAEPDVVLVQVLDRGPGIPAEQRERAFERFSRLDEQLGGAGIGLFLARGLARAMGGEVSVDDREEGGARVCFTLKRRA